MPEVQLILEFFELQPFLAYSLLATFILALVSIISGFLKLDFLGALSPQGLLTLTLSTLVAWLIISQGHLLTQQIPIESLQSQGFLTGLSRLPLYISALAYGPSAGLLAGTLFLSFSLGETASVLVGLILLLELAVLGWFALSPSPRHSRWAGPLGAVLAYSLTWATAGSAYLQWQSLSGSSFEAHRALHEGMVWGAALSAVMLVFIGPQLYKRVFLRSRIVPVLPEKQNLQSPVKPQPTMPAYSSKTGLNGSRTRASLEAALSLPEIKQTRQKRNQSLPDLSPLSKSSRRKTKRELSSIPLEELS